MTLVPPDGPGARGHATLAGSPYAVSRYFDPTDPLFLNQWHLDNTGQSGGTAGIDINVTEVWDDYTGAGVTVGIWDDGVQYTHDDLDGNYDTGLHVTVNGVLEDPLPTTSDSRHGTAVAGVIAAGNDGTGTVGVAFGATIAGVDILSSAGLRGQDFADSMAELGTFDITNHSWGFTSPFAADIQSTDPFWVAFFDGIAGSLANGRGGLGTINLVAAGNDRALSRHTNDSNFVNHPGTIAVAAVNHQGTVSNYSTPGSALLVAAPSNDQFAGGGIWTTDRTGNPGYSNGSNEFGNPEADYTATFGGTSSATPTTSGVVALMLEANPELGWRDVQAILANSARHVGSEVGSAPTGNEDFAWAWNGAERWNGGGMHFSNDYGFGLVDAWAAVRLAETWTDQETSANWRALVADTVATALFIPDDNPTGVGLAFSVTDDVELETVGLNLTIAGGFTGDYFVTLTSPDGTTSILATDHDDGDAAGDTWFVSSNAFRGEEAAGTWTLHVSDRWAAFTGTLTAANLEFYGGSADTDDTFIFTEEFSDVAGIAGHATDVTDTNGGTDAINAAATRLDMDVDLSAGTGTVDGVALGTVSGIENVFSGDGDDTLKGRGTANLFAGGRGDDLLLGKGGVDDLRGGSGDDTLRGGAGSDVLTDGAGADRLHGNGASDMFDFGTDGVLDRVLDFRDGTDLVRLAGLNFAALSIVTQAAGRVRIDHAGDTLILEDTEGDLVAGNLSAADFLFV